MPWHVVAAQVVGLQSHQWVINELVGDGGIIQDGDSNWFSFADSSFNETHAFHGPGATVTIDCPKSLPHCPALSLFGPSSSFQLRLCALVEAVATFWGEMLVIYLSHWSKVKNCNGRCLVAGCSKETISVSALIHCVKPLVNQRPIFKKNQN